MIRVNTLFKYVCYHPLEHQLLTTGTDRKIGFWETLDASMARELDGALTGSVNALDVSPDGMYFVSGGDDKMVKVMLRVSCLCFLPARRGLSHRKSVYPPVCLPHSWDSASLPKNVRFLSGKGVFL